MLDWLFPFRGLTPRQRNVFLASFLGWALDAFDFFILIFVIQYIARDFHESIKAVAFTTTVTLATRPIGALLFGYLADRFGRRPTLMANVVFFSVTEFLSGFAPSLTTLLVLRALYGIGMGGEWGVGASLAMESVPPEKRGVLSGLLQEGYMVGYILAAVAFYYVFPALGWRWMFFAGLVPAPFVFLIRKHVPESEAWQRTRHRGVDLWRVFRRNAGIFVYLVLLMTAFNFMSHGTQDIYPLFLAQQRGLPPRLVSLVTIIASLGALLGGLVVGALSQRIGRRRAIVAAALLALPLIPLWVLPGSIAMLAVGAFLLQFMVQGAWGVIPAHLNELSPDAVRGTFPGFTYQLGNLLASLNLPLQTHLATLWGHDYARSMGVVSAVVLLAVAAVTALGRERPGAVFGDGDG